MKKKLHKLLSRKDLIELNLINYNSLAIDTQVEFVKLITQLEKFLGYSNSACAHGNVVEILTSPNPSISLIDVSYPGGYLEPYLKNGDFKNDTVLLEFFAKNKPINWRRTDEKYGINYSAISSAIDFGMTDGWTYGVLNKKTRNSTVFYFGGRDVNTDERTECIIEYTVPFLSTAYQKVLNIPSNEGPSLTPKELEVLKWMKEGKSSWETSLILNCSKRAIDFHAKNIIAKLDATNRTDAVVKALEKGIMNF